MKKNKIYIKEFLIPNSEIIKMPNIFVYKPVMNIVGRMKESVRNKIILLGNEKTGKELVSLKYISLTEEIPIFIDIKKLENLDLLIRLSKVHSYIEMTIARELLKILKQMGLNSQILLLGTDYYNYENSRDLNSVRQYMPGDLIYNLIYRIRSMCDKNIVLVIKNIEYLEKDKQIILLEYFDIFDKSIVLSKDVNLIRDIKKRESLVKDGYELIDINYTRDEINLEKIVDSRIDLYNNNVMNEDRVEYLDEMLDKDTLSRACNLSNGDIVSIFNAMLDVYSANLSSSEDIEKKFIYSLEKQKVDKKIILNNGLHI